MENSEKLSKTFEDSGDSLTNAPENFFQILNDDCLLHIFSFLSIRDQIKLSLVCQRFYEITEIIFRAFKKLTFKNLEDLTLTQTFSLLNKIGKNITTISYCDYGQDTDLINAIIKVLPHSCPNVEYLHLKSILHIRFENFEGLKTIANNLVSLTLFGCGLTDVSCSILHNCQNLKYLDVSRNVNITGKYLDKLPNLKTLKLWDCSNIQPKCFMEICEVSRLTELNIINCCELDKRSLETLLRTQTELELLKIENLLRTDDLSDILKLPSLTHLDFFAYREMNDFLCELAKHKGKTLRVFSLYANDINQSQKDDILKLTGLEELDLKEMIDNRFLAELGLRIPNLKRLDCSFCHKLNIEAVISYIVNAKKLEYINVAKCFDMDSRLQFALNLIEALKISIRPKPVSVDLGALRVPDLDTKLTFAKYRHLLNLSYETC